MAKPGSPEVGVGETASRETDMAEAGPKLLRGLLEVFLLESLEQEPKHGYALLKEVTEAFGSEPNRNRLYPLLARMVRDGHVRELTEGAGQRTMYTLTEAGRDALRAYRRLPPSFRQTLLRIWGVPLDGAAPPAGQGAPAPPANAPAATYAPAPAPMPAPAARTTTIPLTVRDAHALPYPCPEARVAVERNPTSGDMAVKLSGCPLGSFAYCPQCPIFHAVDGFRRLVFPM